MGRQVPHRVGGHSQAEIASGLTLIFGRIPATFHLTNAFPDG
jgi:hypothetical protein